MPYDLIDHTDTRFRLPATLQPAQRHVGGEPRARFVRGYGSNAWFVTLDGLREPSTVDLVGLLATDRDEEAIQDLIDDVAAAATTAVALAHVAHDDSIVETLPLLGALPITTEPDGIDGSIVRVKLPLIPGGEWQEYDSL